MSTTPLRQGFIGANRHPASNDRRHRRQRRDTTRMNGNPSLPRVGTRTIIRVVLRHRRQLQQPTRRINSRATHRRYQFSLFTQQARRQRRNTRRPFNYRRSQRRASRRHRACQPSYNLINRRRTRHTRRRASGYRTHRLHRHIHFQPFNKIFLNRLAFRRRRARNRRRQRQNTNANHRARHNQNRARIPSLPSTMRHRRHPANRPRHQHTSLHRRTRPTLTSSIRRTFMPTRQHERFFINGGQRHRHQVRHPHTPFNSPANHLRATGRRRRATTLVSRRHTPRQLQHGRHSRGHRRRPGHHRRARNCHMLARPPLLGLHLLGTQRPTCLHYVSVGVSLRAAPRFVSYQYRVLLLIIALWQDK